MNWLPLSIANQITSKYRMSSTIVCLLLFGLSTLMAQSEPKIDQTARQMTEDPLAEFFGPLVDAVGADLNGGWLCNAPNAEQTGLNFRIGIVGMGSFLDSDAEVFDLLGAIFQFQSPEARVLAEGIDGFGMLDGTTQDAIVRQISDTKFTTEISGPTIFGSESDNIVINTDNQTVNVNGVDYVVPAQTITLEDVTGLWDDPGIFPLFSPQLTVGTVFGTQATVRYLPGIGLGNDLGDLSQFGLGIAHNPAVWLGDELPVNLSLGFYYQNIGIGENVLDVNTIAYGLNVSKPLGGGLVGITPYVGYQREKTTMKVDYSYELAPGFEVPIAFDLEAANQNRFIFGLGFNVIGINLFADYNVSAVNSVNVTAQYGF